MEAGEQSKLAGLEKYKNWAACFCMQRAYRLRTVLHTASICAMPTKAQLCEAGSSGLGMLEAAVALDGELRGHDLLTALS